jgi:hypothetical protein
MIEKMLPDGDFNSYCKGYKEMRGAQKETTEYFL